MRLPAPRIIVIDDDLKHLEGLAHGLNRCGAACLPVHFTGETETIPACRYIRVIFVDLHLTGDTPGDHTQNFGVIGGLIEETIKPSGPYLIVLWTKYPEQAAALQNFLKRLENIAMPFAVQALDKNNHLDVHGEVKSPEALVEAIAQIVTEQPQIGALLNWEDQVLGAAADTLSSIMKLSELSPENISRLLASLAIAAVGKEHVEEDRFQAVNEALLPILADRIASMRSHDADDGLWGAALGGEDAKRGLTRAEAAKLNSLLHIAPSTSDDHGRERGAVISLPEEFLEEAFAETFDLASEEAAKNQFRYKPSEDDNDLFRWVLVQTQAACDYAQTQPGPLPFHLGLCLPEARVQTGTPPAALWRSPCFEYKNEASFLHVSARFAMSLPREKANQTPPLFRLREQLLNDLIYQIHGYGARPGDRLVPRRGVEAGASNRHTTRTPQKGVIKESTTALMTGGQTPLPSSRTRSRRVPTGRSKFLSKPMARLSSGTWSMRSLGSSPSCWIRAKRSRVVMVRRGTVQRLPPPGAITSIVDEQEAGVRSKRLEPALRPFQGSSRTPFIIQSRCRPHVGWVQHGASRLLAAGVLSDDFRWRPREVADEKETPTPLRHTEVGRIQYMFMQLVAKSGKIAFQFAVT